MFNKKSQSNFFFTKAGSSCSEHRLSLYKRLCTAAAFVPVHVGLIAALQNPFTTVVGHSHSGLVGYRHCTVHDVRRRDMCSRIKSRGNAVHDCESALIDDENRIESSRSTLHRRFGSQSNWAAFSALLLLTMICVWCVLSHMRSACELPNTGNHSIVVIDLYHRHRFAKDSKSAAAASRLVGTRLSFAELPVSNFRVSVHATFNEWPQSRLAASAVPGRSSTDGKTMLAVNESDVPTVASGTSKCIQCHAVC